MINQPLAIHETLEVHELLSFKNVCCTKSATMQALVTDQALNMILHDDIETSRLHIKELHGILAHLIESSVHI